MHTNHTNELEKYDERVEECRPGMTPHYGNPHCSFDELVKRHRASTVRRISACRALEIHDPSASNGDYCYYNPSCFVKVDTLTPSERAQWYPDIDMLLQKATQKRKVRQLALFRKEQRDHAGERTYQSSVAVGVNFQEDDTKEYYIIPQLQWEGEDPGIFFVKVQEQFRMLIRMVITFPTCARMQGGGRLFYGTVLATIQPDGSLQYNIGLPETKDFVLEHGPLAETQRLFLRPQGGKRGEAHKNIAIVDARMHHFLENGIHQNASHNSAIHPIFHRALAESRDRRANPSAQLYTKMYDTGNLIRELQAQGESIGPNAAIALRDPENGNRVSGLLSHHSQVKNDQRHYVTTRAVVDGTQMVEPPEILCERRDLGEEVRQKKDPGHEDIVFTSPWSVQATRSGPKISVDTSGHITTLAGVGDAAALEVRSPWPFGKFTPDTSIIDPEDRERLAL